MSLFGRKKIINDNVTGMIYTDKGIIITDKRLYLKYRIEKKISDLVKIENKLKSLYKNKHIDRDYNELIDYEGLSESFKLYNLDSLQTLYEQLEEFYDYIKNKVNETSSILSNHQRETEIEEMKKEIKILKDKLGE